MSLFPELDQESPKKTALFPELDQAPEQPPAEPTEPAQSGLFPELSASGVIEKIKNTLPAASDVKDSLTPSDPVKRTVQDIAAAGAGNLGDLLRMSGLPFAQGGGEGLTEIAKRIAPPNQTSPEEFLSGLADTPENRKKVIDALGPSEEEILKKAEAEKRLPVGDLIKRLGAEFVGQLVPLTPIQTAMAATAVAEPIGRIGRLAEDFIMTKNVSTNITPQTIGDFYVFGKERLDPQTYDLLTRLPKEKLVKALKTGEDLVVKSKVPRFGKEPVSTVPGESTPNPDFEIPGGGVPPADLPAGPASPTPENVPRGNVPVSADLKPLPLALPPSGVRYLANSMPDFAKTVNAIAAQSHPEHLQKAVVDATTRAEAAKIRGASPAEAEQAAIEHFVGTVKNGEIAPLKQPLSAPEVPPKQINVSEQVLQRFAPDKSLEGPAALEQQRSIAFASKEAPQLLQQYAEQYGNQVSTDKFRDLLRPQGYTGLNSENYHSAASALRKVYQDLLLDQAKKQGKTDVVVMAGGSGAGKSTALKGVDSTNAAMVLDANLADYKGAKADLDAIRNKGFDVKIRYVYRGPEESWFNGVLQRIRSGSDYRVVPLEKHLDLHKGAFETIFKLAKDFPVKIIDNSGVPGSQRIIPLEELAKKGYTDLGLKERLSNETIQRYAKGEIEHGVVRSALGRIPQTGELKEHFQRSEAAAPAKTESPPKESSLNPLRSGEAATVSSQLKDSSSEIKAIVSPEKSAPLAAAITREQLGKMARSFDKAEASLEKAHKYFEKQSVADVTDFIDKIERGGTLSEFNLLPDLNSSLGIIARQLRTILDGKRAEIRALGTGKLENFITNYFPHLWDQGEKAVSKAIQVAAKRPLEGGKSFLKKRSIEYFKDGIELGLTPVSWNPIDLVFLKIREMDKYLMAHRTIQEFKKNGLAQYVAVGKDHPDGWIKINDGISTVFKSPMVAVKEAYDEKMMSDLNQVAKNLGINLERSPRMKGEGKKYADVWGLSQSDIKAPGKAGKIFTRFAGPESALAHELGHQLDHIYGLEKEFLSDKTIDAELTKLAEERTTEESTDKFEQYVKEPGEKIAAMLESYIHAPDLLKKIAPETFTKLTLFLKGDPKLEPLTRIEPSILLGTNESEVYAGGNVIAGHIWAQPDAARIINNYLSPGLQKSSIYQAYRYAGNALNQFQLGLSFFHLGFTSMDASVSKLALALNKLSLGHPISAVTSALQSPIAPISNIIRGDKLMKAWRGQGKSGIDEILATAMEAGGGRARMDQFYATKAADQMKKFFKAGQYIRSSFQVPMAIMEASSKPILEYIVPRQKLGIFADIVQMELEHNPNMTHEELRTIAQKAWDSVDNRMGQLVYDNLFWNRTFKDLLMGSVRSVGWNLGTIREIGGGLADLTKLGRGEKGRGANLSYRSAYLIALPIFVGMMGAIYQFLRTGQPPQELKDLYFPRTGGIDANGDPVRVSLPSYMKDIYHYATAPVQTVMNKLNPLLAMMYQMYQNKDFYGVEIRNQDDPFVRQLAQEANYIAKQMVPFGIRNAQRNIENREKGLRDVVEPFIGITPAPYDVNETKAEKIAHRIAAGKIPVGGRTQEAADRSRLLKDFGNRIRANDSTASRDMLAAFQKGKISSKEIKDTFRNSHLTPIQRLTHSFSSDELQKVYDAADPSEKQQLHAMLQQKIGRHRRGWIQQGGR